MMAGMRLAYGSDIGTDGTESLVQAERMDDGTIHYTLVVLEPVDAGIGNPQSGAIDNNPGGSR